MSFLLRGPTGGGGWVSHWLVGGWVVGAYSVETADRELIPRTGTLAAVPSGGGGVAPQQHPLRAPPAVPPPPQARPPCRRSLRTPYKHSLLPPVRKNNFPPILRQLPKRTKINTIGNLGRARPPETSFTLTRKKFPGGVNLPERKPLKIVTLVWEIFCCVRLIKSLKAIERKY